jgi:hypothetical protein
MSSDFVEIYNSAYGRCFTFNHISANMSQQNGKKSGMIVTRPGSAFGLRLRLNVRQSEYLYSTDTAGIRMAVHNKGEWPFPGSVIYVFCNLPVSLCHLLG